MFIKLKKQNVIWKSTLETSAAKLLYFFIVSVVIYLECFHK